MSVLAMRTSIDRDGQTVARFTPARARDDPGRNPGSASIVARPPPGDTVEKLEPSAVVTGHQHDGDADGPEQLGKTCRYPVAALAGSTEQHPQARATTVA
jgi:hypothetical protein